MRVEFDKMEGAGNDFILIDNRSERLPEECKIRLVEEFCHRSFGIGADGMIFVQEDPEFDFSWDFYNSDGSRAEMCGNGARCVARFARKIGAAGDRMTFRSLAGPIQAELTGRGAKVGLPDAVIPDSSQALDLDENYMQVWLLNTGVPHAVVQVPDLDSVDVVKVGRQLRYHPYFSPAGTNVDFFSPLAGNRLAIRTYERGVEAETLGCGTGSVATCIVAGRFFGMTAPITALTRGGGELVVHFRDEQHRRATDVFLEGGARMVFTGAFEF